MTVFPGLRHRLNGFRRVHKYSLILYGVSAGVMFWMFAAFALMADTPGNSNKLYAVVKDTGDILLILLPYWLVGRRWRWTVIAPALFVAAFFLINIWYMRFWGDLLPLTALCMAANINGLLLGSVEGVAAPSDLMFVLPPVILLGAIIFLQKKVKKEPGTGWKTKCGWCVTVILIFGMSQLARTHSTAKWVRNHAEREVSISEVREIGLNIYRQNPRDTYTSNGLLCHLYLMVKSYAASRNISRNLTESEIAEVNTFILNKPSLPADSIFAANKHKNIVFVIVESLNSEVIGRRTANREITPVMNALISSEGSVSALNVIPQIRDGGSSDGQMIYNTGLLPLKGAVTSFAALPHNDYVTLLNQFDRKENIAVFADDGTSWYQTDGYKKYGFNTIYTKNDFRSRAELQGCDGAMFSFAFDRIKELKQPFFVQLVSISMHIPFKDSGTEGLEWITENSTTSSAQTRYDLMTAYFDRELGRFIQRMKDAGLWENTILIIASDHSQTITNDGKEHGTPITFIAANTGMTRRIDRKVGQIDAYPTMLRIAGVENPAFSGVGVSMLDSLHSSFDRMDRMDRISELIHCGNYFGKHTKLINHNEE